MASKQWSVNQLQRNRQEALNKTVLDSDPKV